MRRNAQANRRSPRPGADDSTTRRETLLPRAPGASRRGLRAAGCGLRAAQVWPGWARILRPPHFARYVAWRTDGRRATVDRAQVERAHGIRTIHTIRSLQIGLEVTQAPRRRGRLTARIM